jgi:hypothetical protein
MRIFCICGWLAVPINPDKWSSTVRKYVCGTGEVVLDCPMKVYIGNRSLAPNTNGGQESCM